MNLLLSHVSFTYPDGVRPVLDDVSVAFPAGWTGIVGDNGCGKTTLALIAAGKLNPDVGTLAPQLLSEYCHQDSSMEPFTLADFACDWSQHAVRLRQCLRLEDEWLWRFADLSGGQQKRVQVACSLWCEPDLLVMDEPTNGVDAESREAISAALVGFKGIGLLISHDRALLNQLASQCLVFEGGVPVLRPGNYEKAADQGRREVLSAQRTCEQARKEADRIRREALRRREEAQRSRKRLSARNVDKHDSSMREKLGRAKVSSKDGVAGRSSAVMAKRFEEAQGQVEEARLPKRYAHRFERVGKQARAKVVCHVEGTVLVRGGFSLEVPELWVGSVDRIGVAGVNGSGKSTLLRHLLACMADGVRVAYVPQEVNALQRSEALTRLHSYGSEQAGRVLSYVGRLNSDPKRILDGTDISPGELRKLVLAELLLEEPHALVLDEPTNHLDVGAIEALQDLVCAFEGAVVMVSHDATLVRECCTLRWSVTEGEGSWRVSTQA